MWALSSILCLIFFSSVVHASTFSLSSVPVGTVVQTGDLKFVKVNDNNLLVSLQSLTTTNGESPLSLPDSAGLNLTNYQIDGQTVQESPLPEGYTQVEYLQSSGTQYIDTGLITGASNKIEIKYQMLSANVNQMIAGTVGTASRYEWWYNYDVEGSFNIYSFSTGLSEASCYSPPDTNVHTIIRDGGTVYADGANVGTITIPNSCSANFYLFTAYHHNASGKIYYTKIWDNGTLIRNFIPAIRTSDSVAGMYDTVNSVFYTNAGTGTFTTGAAITTPTPDVPWEIQNLGEYNQTSGKYDITTTNLESPPSLQTWQGCADIATPTGLNHSKIVTLTDSRDGKQYRVAKFADGNCWMIDNLKYGGDRTDACAGKTTFNGCGNNKGDYCGGTSSAPGTGVSLYGFWTNGTSTSINQLYGDCRDSAAGASGYCATNDCGYYYSWQAAMQDATAYYNNSSFVQPTEPIQGICPEGWILPTNTGNTSFQNLANLAGATSTNFWQRDLTTADPSIGFLGLYSGYSNATGGLANQGGNGYFWSSTSYSLTTARNLGFNSTGASPTYSNYKYFGFSVRCIQNPAVASHTATFSLSAPLRCVGSGTSQVCDYLDFANQRVVRNVAEVAFNGTEDWFNYGGWIDNPSAWQTSVFSLHIPQKAVGYDTSICNYFFNTSDSVPFIPTDARNGLYTDHPSLDTMYFDYTAANNQTLTNWKSYLAAQYAAGTPVTVQYQLATPTYEYLFLPVLKTTAGTNNVTVGNGTIVQDQKVQSSGIKMNYWRE